MSEDLGTYHVQVIFEGGIGFIMEWDTGARYTKGRHGVSPLDATRLEPTYENEYDLLRSVRYMFLEGNYSCDCNLRNFLADAAQKPRPDDAHCGDELLESMVSLTVIRPGGEAILLFPDEADQGRP